MPRLRQTRRDQRNGTALVSLGSPQAPMRRGTIGRMPRLTRIYTKTGDEGMTGLGGGRRVSKDSPRVGAYGTVDELNSTIGVALALGLTDRLATELKRVQNELFDLGSDLCWPEEDRKSTRL